MFVVAESQAALETNRQLEKELLEERAHYQSLLSEHLQLEERHGDLQDKMNRSSAVRCLYAVLTFTHAG